MIGKTKPFSSEQKSEIKNIMAEAKPIWIKVGILINEEFDHKNSETDAFEKAEITYDEFRNLIDLTKSLIHKISHYYQRSSHVVILGANDSLIELLNDLKELSKIRSNQRTPRKKCLSQSN